MQIFLPFSSQIEPDDYAIVWCRNIVGLVLTFRGATVKLLFMAMIRVRVRIRDMVKVKG